MQENAMRQLISRSTAASFIGISTSALIGVAQIPTAVGYTGDEIELRTSIELENDARYWVNGTDQSSDFGIFLLDSTSSNLESEMMQLTENLLNSAVELEADAERLLYENLSSLY